MAGVITLTGSEAIGAPFSSTIGLSFGLDPLSGFFLAVLAITAVPTLVFARDYLLEREHAGALAALTGVFLLSLAGVLAARDVIGFLACWELMTLVPAAAILVNRRERAVRSAVYSYVAITHVGGAGVWIAMLVLAHHGAIGDPSALAAAGTGTQTLVAVAALVGFGTKAGFVPLHSWLPRAHPVAPAHLSALMSGLMVKIALYGLIRVEFQWLGATPLWLGLTLLGIGLISSLGGILWAVVQRRPEAAARVQHDREHGHHHARPGRVAAVRRGGQHDLGGDRVRAPRFSTSRTTRSSRRCCSLRPARWSGPWAAWTSTSSAGCSDECRGPAARCSSARWRSRACLR